MSENAWRIGIWVLSPRAHTDPSHIHDKINPLGAGLSSGDKASNSEELHEPDCHQAGPLMLLLPCQGAARARRACQGSAVGEG